MLVSVADFAAGARLMLTVPASFSRGALGNQMLYFFKCWAGIRLSIPAPLPCISDVHPSHSQTRCPPHPDVQHSGLAVRAGGTKWIANAWVCQFPPPTHVSAAGMMAAAEEE